MKHSIQTRLHRHPATASAVAGMTFLWMLLLSIGSAQASTALWSAPAVDFWSYQFNVSPGVRAVGSTFRGAFELDANQEFVPETALDPARRAMNFFAFDTSNEVPVGLPVEQYQITSVAMTVRYFQGAFGTTYYSETRDTPSGLLDEVVTGTYSTARPIEMFGAGLRQGYTGFAFAGEFGGNEPYSEGDPVYTEEGYVAYPLVGSDTPGEYHDVSNNITGGFSETAPGNFTPPFDATSWAVGKVPGLSHGNAIPNNTTFTFDVDLELPGVMHYLQQSLATGALAFSISSLNQSSQPGMGFNPYPQWFMKESLGIYPQAEAATLMIEFDLVEPSLPGDFNGDGFVDASDLAMWESHFAVSDGADADGDGMSDGADFLIWQRNYTGPPPSLTTGQLAVVPEPGSLVLLALGSGLVTLARRSRRGLQKELFAINSRGAE